MWNGSAKPSGTASPSPIWKPEAALTTWIDRVRLTMAQAGTPDDGAGIFDDFMLRVVRVERAIRLPQLGPSPD